MSQSGIEPFKLYRETGVHKEAMSELEAAKNIKFLKHYKKLYQEFVYETSVFCIATDFLLYSDVHQHYFIILKRMSNLHSDPCKIYLLSIECF